MEKSNNIPIQGINFLRSGCKGLTRSRFDELYGTGSYWNKPKKNLDVIWGKLQDALGKKKPAKKVTAKKKS